MAVAEGTVCVELGLTAVCMAARTREEERERATGMETVVVEKGGKLGVAVMFFSTMVTRVSIHFTPIFAHRRRMGRWSGGRG